ncbi:hypothetical protein UPYG_G00128460 [Umbra pygmaea]|uniref:MIT domain-containing protein n=1 Tax=Umbra pygmaea TaxID=75934 RepID=A0ABD0X9T5_UMBPY
MSSADPAELLLIRDHYDRALECLTRGLAADQAGQGPQALELYRMGRQHLTHGLEVPTEGPQKHGAPWNTARHLQRKMRETLTNINTRIANMEAAKNCREGQGGPALGDLVDISTQSLYPTLGLLVPPVPQPGSGAFKDQPPAYTPQPTDGHHSLPHSPAKRRALEGRGVGDGEELLLVPWGVQMFFVTPSGEVSAPSSPGYLRIIRVDSRLQDKTKEEVSSFLQVCDWLYPLTPDTPVLLSSSGIFMFPDVMAETPGSYLGIVLSSELPAAHRRAFQELLVQQTELRIQEPEKWAGTEVLNLSEKVPIAPPLEGAGAGAKTLPPDWSVKMSQSILAGSTWLSRGIVSGAEATGKAIHGGASRLRQHITPQNVPAKVSPNVTKGLHHTKQVTGGAVRVSQFLVDGVCSAAVCVGGKLAPHIKKHCSKLIPESMKNSQDGHSNLEAAKVVAASSVKGLSAIWTGLETGAKNIGKSVTSETVTTVKHKFRGLEGILDTTPENDWYGDEVGQATDTGIQSTINVGVTAFNFDHLGIKGIMKAAEKQTSKAVSSDPGATSKATIGDSDNGAVIQRAQQRDSKDEANKK